MRPDRKRQKNNRGKNKRFSDGGKRKKSPYKRNKEWQE